MSGLARVAVVTGGARGIGRATAAALAKNGFRVGLVDLRKPGLQETAALVREAMNGGQAVVHVHAYPFRMTKDNMTAHAKSEWAGFWRTLKEGHDYFELTRQLPAVAVCNRHYVVNVALRSGDLKQLDPVAACPLFRRPKPVPFKPGGEQAALSPPATTPGRSGLSGSAMSTPISKEECSIESR